MTEPPFGGFYSFETTVGSPVDCFRVENRSAAHRKILEDFFREHEIGERANPFASKEELIEAGVRHLDETGVCLLDDSRNITGAPYWYVYPTGLAVPHPATDEHPNGTYKVYFKFRNERGDVSLREVITATIPAEQIHKIVSPFPLKR